MHGLDFARVANVRTATQVNQRTALVYSCSGGIDLLINDPQLELVILYKVQTRHHTLPLLFDSKTRLYLCVQQRHSTVYAPQTS